jgi:hypothetical protein
MSEFEVYTIDEMFVQAEVMDLITAVQKHNPSAVRMDT